MNSTFNKNHYIKNDDDYLMEFKGKTKDHNKIAYQALQVALDTRKFEIELYWKRATYFWAFIAASVTAYFVILTSGNIEDFKHLTIIISLIGYLFSLGWYFVNRGSKYWQENWERHVDKLEDKVIGPLFSWCKVPEKTKWYEFLKGFPMSVSKVNQFLSFVMVIFWFFLFIYSLLFSYDKLDTVKAWLSFEKTWVVLVSWFVVIIVLSVLFFITVRSFVIKNIDNELTNEQREKWLFMSRNRPFFK